MKLSGHILSLILIALSIISSAQIYQRTDTLMIPEATSFPIIDGQVDGVIWDVVDWQPIDQIWMPYNNDPTNLGQASGLKLWTDSTDFSGEYKVIWSSETK